MQHHGVQPYRVSAGILRQGVCVGQHECSVLGYENASLRKSTTRSRFTVEYECEASKDIALFGHYVALQKNCDIVLFVIVLFVSEQNICIEWFVFTCMS